MSKAGEPADLFPRISISGFLGFIAGLGSLFGEKDSWPGLGLGSAREAEALYEQVMLRALDETENAFVDYGERQQRLVKLNEQASVRPRALPRRRRRFPLVARCRADAVTGKERRRTGGVAGLHERRRGLQIARRNCAMSVTRIGNRDQGRH